MKKILYTLLLGIVVISCNKEDLGSSNAPLSLSQEVTIGNDILSVADFSGLAARLGKVPQPKTSASTSKEGGPGSYIKIFMGTQGSYYYEFAWDEDQDNGCPVGTHGFQTIYLVLNDSDVTEVRITPTGAMLLTLPEIPAAFYTLDFKNGFQIDRDGNEIMKAIDANERISFP